MVVEIEMSWETTAALAADTANVCTADTRDVLAADTTDVLAADTTDVLAADTLSGPGPKLSKILKHVWLQQGPHGVNSRIYTHHWMQNLPKVFGKMLPRAIWATRKSKNQKIMVGFRGHFWVKISGFGKVSKHVPNGPRTFANPSKKWFGQLNGPNIPIKLGI